ncbi:Hypothetical predicted protein, partial [Marmota monax]
TQLPSARPGKPQGSAHLGKAATGAGTCATAVCVHAQGEKPLQQGSVGTPNGKSLCMCLAGKAAATVTAAITVQTPDK